jgi:hypothetical protein
MVIGYIRPLATQSEDILIELFFTPLEATLSVYESLLSMML